ncbi:MAG: hypothetical protein OER88_05910 [Planctomycetota bacterium]|nr:hypothetical protein [Planctomycetota bacterium]
MTHTRLLLPSLRLPVPDLTPMLRLAEQGVAGFCVFGGDASVQDILRRLQEAAPHPLLFAADMEDGVGHQVQGFRRHPPAAALDGDAAEAAGIRTAVEARALGYTMTFAPVCDIVSEPKNPIIQARAFRDPVAVAPRFVAGARRMGLRTCAKHFPGHGATTQDSHDALPLVTADRATWWSRDLPPFQACIDAGVDAVMSAHIACPGLTGDDDLPATLSRTVMTDILRGEMGFSGLNVSDALCMDGVLQKMTEAEAARAAIEAGCDLVICPEDVDGVLSALKGLAAESALERVDVAARPLPDPLDSAAERSITSSGTLPLAPGPHPLRICDLSGGGDDLARLCGCRFERYDAGGTRVDAGGATGLAEPVVAVLRRDTAWGGALDLPGFVRAFAREAGLVWVCGPQLLLDALTPDRWIRAPGQDAATLAAMTRRALPAGKRVSGGL